MIRQLVTALDEAGVEIDAEAIADALWLARARREDSVEGNQRQAAAGRPAPTEPRPPDAEPRDPVDGAPSESGGEPAGSATARQAGSGPGAGASSITLPKVHALPRTLELGRALRPLKQRHPSKRRRSLNADATVQYFCDTGVLTPIMVPGAERWFDVDVLVDVGPSMAVWQDTVAEFVSFLQCHGAFREVRRWNMEQADETVRLSRAADARSEAAQLVNPDARRLIMILTDCIAAMWYQAPIWDAIRGWGQFSPVVVISPLPARLWPGTALGSPGVTIRSHRPGAANRLLDVTLPWWWPDDEPPWPAVPVPVITLEADQVASWARMTMGAGGAESPGVFAMPPPGSTGARPGHGRLDAEELVRRFRVTVSPVAYRLAVALSAVLHGPWGLGLARVVQEAVHPDSGQVHLAEVLVGGLVRQAEQPEGQEEPVFEFVDGVVSVLQRSMTGTEALRVLEALSGYIERETGKSPGIAALLLGETAPVDATEEFEEVRAGAANLIQAMGLAQASVAPRRATEAPDTSDLGKSVTSLGEPGSQAGRVVPVIWFMDGQRQVGSGYRVTGRFVLTAAHCVRGTVHRVWLPDGEHAARVVVNGAAEIDLALLEITPGHTGSGWPVEFAKIAPRLRRSEDGEGDYQVDEEMRTIQLLEPGIEKVENWLGIDNLHSQVNIPLVTYLDRALKAKELFKRDRDYVVMNGEVLMRAESTGQIVYGTRYDEGIHQAIEAKEGVPIKEGSQPPDAEVPPTLCARVDRNFSGQIGRCVAIGFPQHAARADAPATIWQVDGWISTSKRQRSWLPRRRRDQKGLLRLKVAGTALRPLPTSETELGRSAWAGMSGAAVFAGGLLVGVVAEHHLPDDSGSLTVVPIEWVERLDGADRVRFLQALGLKSTVEMTLVGTADTITDLVLPVDAERDHVRGPARAPVTLVEYGDYESPSCGQTEPVIRELLVGHGDLRYAWRHLPLTDVHPHAQLAAEGAEAAARQGKFWQMHDQLLHRQDALTADDLIRYAAELGLDIERFTADLRNHAGAAKIAEDVDSADLSSVSGTPTFFINGKRHYGAYDISTLTGAVRTAGAQAVISSGRQQMAEAPDVRAVPDASRPDVVSVRDIGQETTQRGAAITTVGEGSTLTALDLLFGPDTDAAETLAGEILSSVSDQNLGRALAHYPEMTRKAAAQEAATAAAALLEVDLIAELVAGWRKHRDIISAARRTLAAADSTELVSTSSHEVTLDQRPSVSVLVDGLRVATLQLDLSIAFDVSALLLEISGGRLAAVRSGNCDITATLAIQGTDLLTRNAHLELPGVISSQRGIRLLPIDEYPADEDLPGEYPGRGANPGTPSTRAADNR